MFIVLPFAMNVPFYKIRHCCLRRCFRLQLGINSSILRNVSFLNPENIIIGEHCVINSYCLLDGRGGKLNIGNNVDIAREVNIFTLEHNPNSLSHAARGADVTIEDHVWVASRVTILPGVKIGRGAVLACGCVVTKDVPEKAIVGGIPAKVIGYRENELKYELNYQPLFR